MTDDRDWSWLHRSTPAAPAAVDHALWSLAKAGHRVDACTRATLAGPELRIAIDGELWWSQVVRPPTEAALTAAAEAKRRDFEAKGWALLT